MLDRSLLFWNRPRLVMVELTNLCNLRCVMCGIWEESPKRTFDLDLYRSLLEERAVRGARVLALSGGEPFMIPNIGDYYELARRSAPRRHVNVSTNGYYTDRTLDFLGRADRARTSITISYDGVRSHDKVRRVEGSAARLLRTAAEIRTRFPEVRLALKLTVTSDNHLEIAETARLCERMGIPFLVKTLEKLQCHQSRFPSPVQGPDYDSPARAAIVAQAREVLAMGHRTNRGYLERLLRDGGAPGASCACSPRTLFVGIDGKVFLCRRKDPIGNLHDAGLDALWRSGAKRARQAEMAACGGSPDGLAFASD